MRSLLRPLLFALALLAALPAAGSHPWGPLPAKERQALIDLYNATNGADWINNDGWLGPVGTECDWHGLACSCEPAPAPCPSVYEIELRSNNLRGRLPASIGDLRRLWTLDLSVNRLRGELPPELGRLRRLKLLELGENELTGKIPAELGQLTRLWWLNLAGNKLRGVIPIQLANLKSVQVLSLRRNRLEGAVPPWLGALPRLANLALGQNDLSGPIPKELFDLEHLNDLSLDGNHLSGPIPENIGSHDLHSVFLQGNRLTGPIPESILNLDFLSYINVQWNALYSTSTEIEQFLNPRGGSGIYTQTLAPDQLAAVATSPTSARLDWTSAPSDPEILNKPGGYLVYAKTGSGAYRLIKTVTGKQRSTVTLTGLAPGTTYTFSLRTFTRPHMYNKNTVRSGLAQPVTVTTWLAERAGENIP